MRRELHLIAAARSGLDCRSELTPCAMCGSSPFDVAGSRKKILGAKFTNFDILYPHDDVCEGCKSLLAGKPGSQPPPLRMTSFIVSDGRFEPLDRSKMWDVLHDGNRGEHVLSWAIGKKVHHWLFAGLSCGENMLIGSDLGVMDYRISRDVKLLDAVEQLVSGFSRSAVERGEYHPRQLAKFGVARWSTLEPIVRRYRPSALLSLACWCAPKSAEDVEEQGEDVVLSSADQDAVDLIADIAHASRYRRRDGKNFWGGVLRHRLERTRNLDVHTMISRLFDWLEVDTTNQSAKDVAERVVCWERGREEAAREAIKKRPALIIALAFDKLRGGAK